MRLAGGGAKGRQLRRVEAVTARTGHLRAGEIGVIIRLRIATSLRRRNAGILQLCPAGRDDPVGCPGRRQDPPHTHIMPSLGNRCLDGKLDSQRRRTGRIGGGDIDLDRCAVAAHIADDAEIADRHHDKLRVGHRFGDAANVGKQIAAVDATVDVAVDVVRHYHVSPG